MIENTATIMATNQPAAERKKRQREVATSYYLDEEASTGRQGQKRRKLVTGRSATLEQKEVTSLITARMPLHALTADWSRGKNRPVNMRHVQKLKRRFMGSGLKREAPENYMHVLCGAEDVRLMMEHLGRAETDQHAGHEMLDFRDWKLVNGGVLAEILAGQHRKCTLEVYVKEAKLDEGELWWPCVLHTRGTSCEHGQDKTGSQVVKGC